MKNTLPNTYLLSKEGLQSLVVVLAVTGGLCALVAFALVPFRRHVAALGQELTKAEARRTRYQDFNGFSPSLDQQRQKVQTAMSMNDSKEFSEKMENTSIIGKICEETGITLDSSRTSTYKDKPAWVISFAADFPRAHRFITTLEKRFRLESFRIRSGDGDGDNKCELIITAMENVSVDAAPAAAGPLGDLFDIYSQTDENIKKIETYQSEISLLGQGLKRDPLFGSNGSVPPPPPPPQQQNAAPPPQGGAQQPPKPKPAAPVKQAAPAQEQPAAPKTPQVSLGGIIWDPENPVAILDGQVLHEGQEVRGVRVVKIKQSSVDVIWQSRTFTLKLR